MIVQLVAYGQTKTLDFANLVSDPNGTQLGTTSFTQTTAAQESWTFTMAANSPGFWTYNDQTLWFQSGDPTPTETGKAKTSIKRADGQNFNFKTINFVTFSQDQFNVNVIRHARTSPDGKWLVFNGVGYLWKKSLPDGKPERITTGTDFEFEPSFSPDGKSILYTTWNDTAMGAIFKLALAPKSKPVKLTADKGIFRSPSFSSDG
ncbi:MAG: hypothetical protein EOO68_10120 [Moraxellaceae bacterium]|nr:MAG: hypothetical protein EOO68_10120 [Moraxellaceae bacterium]